MSVVEGLKPQPGQRIVDLAAAPGGKTTHLAAAVGPDGVVLANEVAPKRLRSLHDNLDLWGTGNVVTSHRPLDSLAAEAVPFDAAVLDAPCSGEALFRRDPKAVRHWSPAAVEGAARRQRELLRHAAAVVRPGGVLMYSTCSFGLVENEQQVIDFLASTDEWTLEDCVHDLGVDRGVAHESIATDLTARFWPHRHPGEGQYVARFRRESGRPAPSVGARTVRTAHERRSKRSRRPTMAPEEVLAAWHKFRRDTLWGLDDAGQRLLVRDDRLYLAPWGDPGIEDRLLARPGLLLGQARPGRFVPDPGLATTLTADEAIRAVSWGVAEVRLAAHLRGETVADPGPDGWVLVCLERWGLSWARRAGGVLKNHVPPHVRRQAAAFQRRAG